MISSKKISLQLLLTVIGSFFYMQASVAGIAIERWTQASGAQVFLVQSHGIPMVDVQLDFDAGSRRDPAGQAGLASVTASLSRMGVLANPARGEAALDENALGEAWADLGANFGGHASDDRMSFALRSLTYPDLLNRAAQLAARQLAEPAFPEHVWQRERETMIAAIKEADTRPATLAQRAFDHAVFGTPPYGYDTNETSLRRIEVAHMAALYRQSIQPCRAKVTVVGAVDRAQADGLVRQLFSGFTAPSDLAACAALPAVPEVPPLRQAQDLRMPFDSAQAHVLIGQPGFRRADPDYFALTVGNYILGGGGFASRLTEAVREKRGLSYSVYSAFAPGLHAGAFVVGLQTRPDQADQAVQVAREVVRHFITEGPTSEELQAAKANLIGGFALRIDSNRKLLGNLASMAWHGLPLDYLETWTRQVDRVTVADIQVAFARKLQPDRMVTVVVGGTAVPR
mgnify:CR=1 FL=1